MAEPRPRSEFGLLVSMESDWHVGAGAGRIGRVDRTVLRDAEGLPYLPAKTLTGIWRDACEQVAWALDGGGPGGWQEVLAAVFGDQPGAAGGGGLRRPLGPRPAALSVRPARLGGELRAALSGPGQARDAGRFHLLDALTLVRPGVSIDPDSGRARDDHLRFMEMVRGGCTLRADGCRLDLGLLPEEQLQRAAWALLVAGMRFVDRLGGGRRRGAGRCRCSIADTEGVLAKEEELAVAEWVRAHPEAPAVGRSRSVPRPLRPLTSGGGEWVDVGLRLRLLDPAVVASRVVGNVTVSLDHVPGRLLLPLVERACASAGFDAGPAIRRGDLMVLNAYPELDGVRGRPVPLSFQRAKDAGDRGEFCVAPDEPTRSWKQVREGFVGAWDEGRHEICYDRTKTGVHLHNAVDDADQRPKGAGGVYAHEAIRPGTVLRSVVRLRMDLAERLGDWWRHLEKEQRLGRSKKDDFGRVEIELADARDAEQRLGLGAGEFRIWCLSDVLLDEDHSREATSAPALVAELRARLRMDPPDAKLEDEKLGIQEAHVRVRRHDAWQTRWGMPRPSLVAIAAGSVLRVRFEGKIDPARAEEVARAGLGLRRAEGFGEIVLDSPLPWVEGKLRYRPPDPAQVGPDGPLHATGEDLAFAQVVEREAWRSLIRARAVERGSDEAFRSGRLRWRRELSRSQLGTLRATVRMPDRADRVERLAVVSRRREEWGGDAIEVLRGLCRPPGDDGEASVWKFLGADEWPELTIGGAARLRRELWEEALVLLIDEAARRRLDAGGGS